MLQKIIFPITQGARKVKKVPITGLEREKNCLRNCEKLMKNLSKYSMKNLCETCSERAEKLVQNLHPPFEEELLKKLSKNCEEIAKNMYKLVKNLPRTSLKVVKKTSEDIAKNGRAREIRVRNFSMANPEFVKN